MIRLAATTWASILIVEDERIVAKDLQQTLNEMGYNAYAIAASAAEAVAHAESVRPDLVLMDIRIKGQQDGIDVAQILKARFNAGIIFLTAHSDDAIIERVKRSEPDGYLLKPVKAAALRSVIEIALYKLQLRNSRQRAAQLEREKQTLEAANRLNAVELQAANLRLTALTELNLQLASERDLEQLLQKVCAGARTLIGAAWAALAVTEKHSGGGLFFTESGIDSKDSLPLPPPPDQDPGPLGRVHSQRTTWRVRYRAGDPPLQALPEGFPTARSLLAAPIGSFTNSYGWVCLGEKTAGGEFTAEDERLLGVLAAQAGRIYENGSLHREVQMHAAHLQIEMDERALAMSALQQSEERFRQLAENIQDVFFIFSPKSGESLYCSPAFEKIWGRPRSSSDPLDWTRSIHPDDRPVVLDHLAQSSPLAASDDLEYRILLPNGSIRWILSRHFSVLGDHGKPYRVVGVATDVTERKQAEERIQHLNRVYAVLSGINSLIVRVLTQDELFYEACKVAVREGDFALAWIGLVNAREATVTPVAYAGEGSYLEDSVLKSRTIAVAQDPFIEAAVRLGQPQICNDLVSSGPTVHFGAAMIERGCRSLVALPLLTQSKTVACLVLATTQRESFDEPEMRLLCELSDDISFALDHIEKASRLNYLAYYDALTGLANRTLFLERLGQAIGSAGRSDKQFLVVVSDLERFDTINDTYGRKKGDELLKAIADRFILCLDEHTTVARVAPDHFAAFIQFAGEAEAAVADFEGRYQDWLGAPFTIDETELSVSARSGISVYPHDGTDSEALLKNAEAALKRAKSSGEKFVFFTKEISEKVAERLAIETQLRRALTNQEFVLHYQAKVDLETREVEGVEALIRWMHPQKGLVPPANFIAILEETGMIVEAGSWALRKASQDRAAWLGRGLSAPRIAVNVSSVQLRKPDFVSVLIDAICPHEGADRRRLAGAAGIDIEVTESLLLDGAESNIEKLREVRSLGVGIAIDDFGTGYSSLSYLTKLPVGMLKMDRAFISAMLDDPSVMTLVSTMIALAHSLKLKVVAEGVELEEQAKILRLLRCDQMQGFLIGRPVGFETMTHYLERLQPGSPTRAAHPSSPAAD
jgi:diguanylate cyclase (GGDEF)-like protein/PAS domain S-box-containing protein